MFFLRSFGAILFTVLVLASSPGHARGTLAGSWTGNLICGGYNGQLLIETDGEPAPGMFSGTVSFELDPDSRNALKGVYSFAARLLDDGSFEIKPREWIERPRLAEYVLDFKGRLNQDGWRMEGIVPLCARGRFSAALDDFDMSQVGLLGAIHPPSGGNAQGHWKGHLSCVGTRRKGPEQYPLELSLWQHGGDVGGIATLYVYKKFGSNAGPTDVQTTLLRGRVEGEGLILDRVLPIETAGRHNHLHSLSAKFTQTGELVGSSYFPGCETLALSRVSPTPVSANLDILKQGPLGGVVGTRNDAVISARIGPDGTVPFVEIRAQKPLSRREVKRERLKVFLAPVMSFEDSLIAVPISYPEIVGKFERNTTLGLVGNVMAFVFVRQTDGTMVITAAQEMRHYRAALANNSQQGAQTVSVHRLDEEALALLGGGQAPAVDLGPNLSGALASATSRQEQCRILDAWISPHAEGQQLRQASHFAVLMPAFDDENFGPVFGLPFDFLAEQDLAGLATLASFCSGNMQMGILGQLERYVFRSSADYRRFTSSLVNRRETSRWFAATVEEIENLPASAEGLARLKEMDSGIRRRQQELPSSERTHLSELVATRTKEIEVAIVNAERAGRIAALMSDANDLPDSGFEDGSLNEVFRFMKRLYDQGLDTQDAVPMREIAQAKAAGILTPVFEQARVLAEGVASSADGLAEMMTVYNRLRPVRAEMDRYFGTIDRDGHLKSFNSRLGELWRDDQVRQEVVSHLSALQTGADFRPAIRAEASRYIDLDRLQHAPGYREIIATLIDDAEVSQIKVVDLSTNQDPGEPTAQEIAQFVLSRVRNLNSGTASMEQACLSGAVNDPVMAFACLAAPGVYTGQSGTTVRLLSVTKITCETEVADRQYRCTFLQEIDINLRGASQSGLGGLTTLASGLASNEPIDARFIRAAAGGWNVIWGDLKR